MQEMLLAMQIERHFTKPQIFTLYANQIYLGHGVYGFEAASEYYFSKPARQLTLDEAALLAGLPKSPGYYSPINHPEHALRRRNLVINSMLEDGKITAAQAARTKDSAIQLMVAKDPNSLAPYFVEDIRRYLENKYGTDEVHQGGLRVYTSLDMSLQRAANQAVLDGLAAYERRHRWKARLPNAIAMGVPLDKYRHPDWDNDLEVNGYVHALVIEVRRTFATIKFGDYIAAISQTDAAWTGQKIGNILSVGDVVYVKILSLGKNGQAKVSLEQDSGVQGALLAINNASGEIKAMVGGRDFEESKFNRATQAMRQVGSSFKPYIYTAVMDRGGSPNDTILDAPTMFQSGSTAYIPHNYDEKFEGNITLRRALLMSRNIPALKLADQLGMKTVLDYAHRFGITSNLPPYLPVALGAAEVTLLEQTSAYSVFPNDGVRIVPRYITKVTDYEGRILEEDFPEVKDVVGERTARMMVSMLRDVVLHGTAIAASGMKYPVAGKTGTTNDFTDAWFVGFSPSMTCGVWLGFDEKKSLGAKETGARAALPIWINFMNTVLAGTDPGEFEAAPILPPSPVALKIDTPDTAPAGDETH
jgi:penicillin-binding protein 1A